MEVRITTGCPQIPEIEAVGINQRMEPHILARPLPAESQLQQSE